MLRFCLPPGAYFSPVGAKEAATGGCRAAPDAANVTRLL
jgi:hypothetical protein